MVCCADAEDCCRRNALRYGDCLIDLYGFDVDGDAFWCMHRGHMKFGLLKRWVLIARRARRGEMNNGVAMMVVTAFLVGSTYGVLS